MIIVLYSTIKFQRILPNFLWLRSHLFGKNWVQSFPICVPKLIPCVCDAFFIKKLDYWKFWIKHPSKILMRFLTYIPKSSNRRQNLIFTFSQIYLSSEERYLHSCNEERTSKVNSSSGSHRKNPTRDKQGMTETNKKQKNTHWYEQKCESLTCSGTIKSSMYHSDFTTTTSPLTSSAPYSWAPTHNKLRFCCNSRSHGEDSTILLASNRPQQQWQDKETKKDRKGKEKLKERTNTERLWTSGLTRSSPLTRPEAKSFWKCQRQKFQTGIFLLEATL